MLPDTPGPSATRMAPPPENPPKPIEHTDRLRTRTSPDVWIVVDPVQDWEESKVILGVYGSLSAAVVANDLLRRLRLDDWDRKWRLTHIERWQGGAHIETHEYNPKHDNGMTHGWRVVLR